jgi:hypothetical protein
MVFRYGTTKAVRLIRIALGTVVTQTQFIAQSQPSKSAAES